MFRRVKGFPIGIEHKTRGPLWEFKGPMCPIIRYAVAPERYIRVLPKPQN